MGVSFVPHINGTIVVLFYYFIFFVHFAHLFLVFFSINTIIDSLFKRINKLPECFVWEKKSDYAIINVFKKRFKEIYMTFGEFINKYNIQLNEQQLAAVKSVEKPTLILAVPGSGKPEFL